MTYSTLWLSQIQFFTSLSFMLLFLVIELGLAWVLLYFKIRSWGPDHVAWTAAYRFWVRVFALAFIFSFAASLPVLIQLGSLWPTLMDKIGNVAGPLLAAGMLSAFIFKSCFLGAMLFGQRRFSDKVHTLVIGMVAIGVTILSFWLLVLLAWMHTPAGATLVEGKYLVNDWFAVIFSPALPWYAALFVLTSALTVAFLMLGIVAAQSLRRPTDDSSRLVFRTGLWIAAISIVLQIFAVAGTGRMTAQHQPAKAAAAAAYWRSDQAPDLLIWGWPDVTTASNRAATTWARAASPWLGRDFAGKPRGLDQFAGMAPPVAFTFWAFRCAVIVGLLMALIAWLILWRSRRVAYDASSLSPRWCRLLKVMTFSGWLMLLPGLAYVMLGSYPFAVNGTITVSEILGATSLPNLAAAYAGYLILYGVLLLGFLQMLRHIARYGVVPIARRRGRA